MNVDSWGFVYTVAFILMSVTFVGFMTSRWRDPDRTDFPVWDVLAFMAFFAFGLYRFWLP